MRPCVQSAQSRVCAHICARSQGTGHVSGSPLFACMLACTGLGSRCCGEGRVLAHTSKQHHELLLPAYLKIATAEETRPHRALGEGWVESGRGMAQSLCSALSLSLHLPPAQRSLQGYLRVLVSTPTYRADTKRDKWMITCAISPSHPVPSREAQEAVSCWERGMCTHNPWTPPASSLDWRDFTAPSLFQGTPNKQLKILVALPTKPSLPPISQHLLRVGIWGACPAGLTGPVSSLRAARGSGPGSC